MTQRDYVGGAVGVVVLATLIIIALMIGSQALWWLEHGTWPDLPLSKLLAELGIERPIVVWRGVQKIIDTALSLHAGIAVFLVGLGLAFLVGWLVDQIATLFSPLPPRR